MSSHANIYDGVNVGKLLCTSVDGSVFNSGGKQQMQMMVVTQEKHSKRCYVCKSGKTCYHFLKERGVSDANFSSSIYLAYLIYAPLYIAGSITSFNAYAPQLERPQKNYKVQNITWIS
ncbi:uncharacterized protein LOC126655443 isoform X2 [Mercurialis annua]|uniref:uncharacterized protein LOC126655443 isoform X2 n=1 Tax=Mercurialis annua TaxID=3986 RepID=UPI0024AE461D|nr:uncharacterized protein LOC126655443 isoform X2 [Mercurialis annua]